jgi:hypothetical protein
LPRVAKIDHTPPHHRHRDRKVPGPSFFGGPSHRRRRAGSAFPFVIETLAVAAGGP